MTWTKKYKRVELYLYTYTNLDRYYPIDSNKKLVFRIDDIPIWFYYVPISLWFGKTKEITVIPW